LGAGTNSAARGIASSSTSCSSAAGVAAAGALGAGTAGTAAAAVPQPHCVTFDMLVCSDVSTSLVCALYWANSRFSKSTSRSLISCSQKHRE
jgi:hypothetical protein